MVQSFNTFRRSKGEAFTCGSCGQHIATKAGSMGVFRAGRFVCPGCRSPHANAMAASLTAPPPSALKMLRHQPGEVVTNTPAEVMKGGAR